MSYNRFKQDPNLFNWTPSTNKVDNAVGHVRNFLSAIGMLSVFLVLCFLAGYYGG